MGTRSKPNGIVVLVTLAAGAVLGAGVFAARGSTPSARPGPALDKNRSADAPGAAAPAALERLPRLPMAPQLARPTGPDPAVDPEPHPAGPPTTVNPPPLHSASELDAYLMTLESRAQQNHRATAAEVEPGIKAIMGLAPQIGPNAAMEKVLDFNKRMTAFGGQQAE